MKPKFRTFLIPIFSILLFAFVAVLAIIFMESQKIKPLENDSGWFESYFVRKSSTLSEQQKIRIYDSVTIVSNVDKDAGVKVKLRSACGNGYNTYFVVDMSIPEKLDEDAEWFFETVRLLNHTDNGADVSTYGATQVIHENVPAEAQHAALLQTDLCFNPYNGWKFDSGLVHILQLTNLYSVDDNGKRTQIEGQWKFSILFQRESELVELIQDPVMVEGLSYLQTKSYQAKVNSFILSEFSAYGEYELIWGSPFDIMQDSHPMLIMKDGSSVPMSVHRMGDQNLYTFDLAAPIALDEVDSVQLTDKVCLPLSVSATKE